MLILQKYRFLPAILAAVIGVAISQLATKAVLNNEQNRILLEMERRAENHMRALEYGVTERIRLTEEWRVLLATSKTLSHETFRNLIRQADFVWRNAKAVVWATTASEKDKNNPLIYFCEPDPACRELLGKDRSTHDNWQAAFGDARLRKKTSTFSLLNEALQQGTDLGVITPVFQGLRSDGVSPDRRLRSLSGYIVGIFSFSDMVEEVLSAQTVPSGLDAYFFNKKELKSENLIHFHASRSATSSRSSKAEHDFTNTSDIVKTFRIANLEWSVVFRPIPEAMQQLKSNEAIAVLILGFLVTSIVTLYLAFIVRRTSKIEELVRARTVELHDANIALKSQTSLVHFLRTIAVRANEASSIEDALETGLEEICRFIGWPVGHAFSVTTDGTDELRSSGIWWQDDGIDIQEFYAKTSQVHISQGESLPGKVWSSKQPIFTTEFEATDTRAQSAAQNGIKAAFGFPILCGDEVVVVLEFFTFDNVPQTPAFMQPLDFIGTQLGRVFERNMSEEKLRTARDHAEQANLAKSKFLAAASHDLRQPLQAMNLFINVLSGRNQNRDNKEIFGHLKDAMGSLGDILNTLLNISKLEAGLIVPRKSDFHINGIFQRFEDEFQPLFKKAGLELRVIMRSGTVHSDPVLMERILRNLLSNALRNTDKGRVLLGALRQGNSLRVGVWDTGKGIPEDQLDLIFKEFFQVERGNEDVEEGVGLGLAIVARLAKLLNHEISVKSKLGKGSAFMIKVPLMLKANNPSLPAKVSDISPSVFSLDGKVVLVIDDEEKVRIAMRYQLERWGGEVIKAASIGEALSRISKKVPDLILADFRLRKGELGHKAIRALRKKSKQEIPGILITGDTAPKRLQKAEKSGLRLLHKPISADVLRVAIQEELDLTVLS